MEIFELLTEQEYFEMLKKQYLEGKEICNNAGKVYEEALLFNSANKDEAKEKYLFECEQLDETAHRIASIVCKSEKTEKEN